jgi:glycosyltransferase involved in cell wall biosynthesis
MGRMRLAWFSPVPPVRSGIATNSAELVAALSARHEIDVFVDEPVALAARNARSAPGGATEVAPYVPLSAHDFIWRNRQQPYDLTIFQVGNSSHHNYLWPYLFRYPGLVVLHDAQLHHARAAALLTEKRAADYVAEFTANHPDVNPDLAQIGVKGFDTYLYYMWPMTRLVVESARLAAMHWTPTEVVEGRRTGIETIALHQGVLVDAEREARARLDVRARYGIASGAMLFGVFGGLTPEKRIPQILDAFAATRASIPAAHLLLAGAPASQYDVEADVQARGLAPHVTITGYLDGDDRLTDAIAACDVSLNMRWPTAREISGPWLRALAAGKPAVALDLAHLWDVPSLDPRSWTPNSAGVRAPVTVAIDILDEDHSLRLAMQRLGTDAALRVALGSAARDYWRREHSLERSVADYERVIARAAATPAPQPALPAHLLGTTDRKLAALLKPFGLAAPF